MTGDVAGLFRIIYKWHASLLEIVAAGPRESIYPTILERLQHLPLK